MAHTIHYHKLYAQEDYPLLGNKGMNEKKKLSGPLESVAMNTVTKTLPV